jgi:tRNA threonylcarbamoyladenosine biosynthesis protein TsaB
VIVLGFDTATPATAVGLLLADGTTLSARDDPAPQERPGHTARLLALARELLAGAELRWEDVQLIAVGVGPGTFTGLRIGVATARGLAQSLGVELVGVSTPHVLAEAAIGGWQAAQPEGGVLAVIDARRGQAFVAAYGSEPEPPGAGRDAAGEVGVSRVHAAGTGAPRIHARELVAPQALAPAELAGVPAAVGGGREWLAVGDGAVRFREHLEAVGIAVAVEGSPLHRVDAGVLCELALTAPRGAPEAVLPDYRRRPDAEIALEDAEQ